MTQNCFRLLPPLAVLFWAACQPAASFRDAGGGKVDSGSDAGTCSSDCTAQGLVCRASTDQCVECTGDNHCTLDSYYDDECAGVYCDVDSCEVYAINQDGNCTMDNAAAGTCDYGACFLSNCSDTRIDSQVCSANSIACGQTADDCNATRDCGDCGDDQCHNGSCVDCALDSHCTLDTSYNSDCSQAKCYSSVCGVASINDSGNCTTSGGQAGTCTNGGCVENGCTDSRTDAAVCSAAGASCGTTSDNCGANRNCGGCGSQHCANGACVECTSVSHCQNSNPCTEDSCSASGACIHTNRDGLACIDGAVTGTCQGDTCVAGCDSCTGSQTRCGTGTTRCQFGPLQCDFYEECQNDCWEVGGVCEYEFVCQNGACDPPDCDAWLGNSGEQRCQTLDQKRCSDNGTGQETVEQCKQWHTDVSDCLYWDLINTCDGGDTCDTTSFVCTSTTTCQEANCGADGTCNSACATAANCSADPDCKPDLTTAVSYNIANDTMVIHTCNAGSSLTGDGSIAEVFACQNPGWISVNWTISKAALANNGDCHDKVLPGGSVNQAIAIAEVKNCRAETDEPSPGTIDESNESNNTWTGSICRGDHKDKVSAPAADWTLLSTDPSRNKCCANTSDCVTGQPANPSCETEGTIVTNDHWLCGNAIWYECGSGAVCAKRPEVSNKICDETAGVYAWRDTDAQDVGNHKIQLHSYYAADYNSSNQSWSGAEDQDYWSCCYLNDCVGTANNGTCYRSNHRLGTSREWMCFENHWYECGVNSSSAQVGTRTCGQDNADAWVWSE